MKVGDKVRLKDSEDWGDWTGTVISLEFSTPFLFSFGVIREKEDKALVQHTDGTKEEHWIEDLEVISEAK